MVVVSTPVEEFFHAPRRVPVRGSAARFLRAHSRSSGSAFRDTAAAGFTRSLSGRGGVGEIFVYLPNRGLMETGQHFNNLSAALLSLHSQAHAPGLSRDQFQGLERAHAAEVASRDPCRERECSVCMDEFRDDETLVQLPCSGRHVFHEACLWQVSAGAPPRRPPAAGWR